MSNIIDSSVTSSMNATAGGSSARESDELRENFMTLLITQLQNQDPLNPMENAEMTSQLAQINTVSGIEELNSTLEGITGQIDAGHTLQAVGLIGQGVLVPGERILVGKDGATPFGIELDKSADSVKATIRDGGGQVVRSFDLGAVSSGVESFEWDGKLDGGEMAPEGAYSISFEATAGDDSVDVKALNYAVVSGVSSDSNGSPRLDLGGINEQASLEDIRQILQL